jgi:hypothetical protein
MMLLGVEGVIYRQLEDYTKQTVAPAAVPVCRMASHKYTAIVFTHSYFYSPYFLCVSLYFRHLLIGSNAINENKRWNCNDAAAIYILPP